MEPTVLNKIRAGKYKDLYDPDLSIAGKEDSAGIFAVGMYSNGSLHIDNCMEKVRILAEQSNNLSQFSIFHAAGGGTGSGFGSLLLQRLSDEFSRK